MKFTTFDRCPQCKNEISTPWDDDIHGLSGRRHMKCPYPDCGYEFDMDYRSVPKLERIVNNIIKNKSYLKGVGH